MTLQKPTWPYLTSHDLTRTNMTVHNITPMVQILTDITVLHHTLPHMAIHDLTFHSIVLQANMTSNDPT